MQWVPEQTMVEAWVVELGTARHEIQDAHARVVAARHDGEELVAATAWASPAMAAFQRQQEVWLAELARWERDLDELDTQLAVARARLIGHGWSGVLG
jgi:hypothetical protein